MPTVKGRKSGGGSPPKKKSNERKMRKAATARPLKTKGKAPARKAAPKAASPRKSSAKSAAKPGSKSSSGRLTARKPAARTSTVRKLVRKAAAATKSVAKKATAAGKKVAKPVRKAGKAVSSKSLKAVKKAATPRAVPRPVRHAAPAAKPVKPAKSVAKPQKTSPLAVQPAKAKAQEKKAATPAAPLKGKKAAAVETSAEVKPLRPAAKAADKKPAPPKGSRRARTRVSSSDGPVATWLTPENRPRPSSFIPAPPRAESPSLVAAPPASSDRLIHPLHLEEPEPGIRLYPVRVDIEQSGGRIYVVTNPEQLSIHLGEGVEWDFRYLGGADAIVEEIVIEMEKPGPFTKTTFKSQKPGSARPHRQLSGPVVPSAAGKRFQYTIRCSDVFKRVIGTGRPYLVVV